MQTQHKRSERKTRENEKAAQRRENGSVLRGCREEMQMRLRKAASMSGRSSARRDEMIALNQRRNGLQTTRDADDRGTITLACCC